MHAFAIPVITALQIGFSHCVGRMELVSGTRYLCWVGLQCKRGTRHYTAILELELFVEEHDEGVITEGVITVQAEICRSHTLIVSEES